MDFLSPSFAAQRLEFVGRTAHVNAALDELAQRPIGEAGVYPFFGPERPFSQWHPARFRVSGHDYESSGQYAMHHKALLFGDEPTAQALLAAPGEAAVKTLGRGVRDYDDATWQREARRIVYEGNCAKFAQNPSLSDALLATGDRLLAEAAPDDRLWGIGLAEDDPRALDKATWLGTNWLGFVLTLLRDDIRLTTRAYPA